MDPAVYRTSPKIEKYIFKRSPMEKFPKTYENYFLSQDKLSRLKSFWPRVYIRKPIRFKQRFFEKWTPLFSRYTNFIWDMMVEYVYLIGKVDYQPTWEGKRRLRSMATPDPDGKYRTKLHNLLDAHSNPGISNTKLMIDMMTWGSTNLLSNPPLHNVLISYIRDMYDLLRESPYIEENKDKFKFPYKYMDLACLMLVAEMPERYDLLEYWEEHELNFHKFWDFIINYISNWNEKYGEMYKMTKSAQTQYLWQVEVKKNKRTQTEVYRENLKGLEAWRLKQSTCLNKIKKIWTI